VTEEQACSWRRLGDPLCDDALRAVFPSSSSSVGQDLLASIEQYAAEHPDCSATTAFLEEVFQVPEFESRVTSRDVRLAQELFLDNSIEIVQALLHYSLAGGFASPRIVRTLQAVSYLVPHVKKNPQSKSMGSSVSTSDASARVTNASNERTFVRLLETFQFVLDVLDCNAMPLPARRDPDISADSDNAQTRSKDDSTIAYLMPGGAGWRSTVNVRLLHAVARMRARERWRREGMNDVEDGRIPINQEELGATLAAFSTIPVWCLHRLNVPPSEAHTAAYLSLWRHVGFYLGVSPSILSRHFSSPIAADKFIATTALHLFSTEDPTDVADAPTIPILIAASNRPPTFTSFEYNCAMTWYLLGPSLAARVGVSPPSLRTWVRMHAGLFVQRIPHWFAQYYPRKGWILKRRAVMKEGVARSLRWNLGMRKVSFRPRTEISDGGEGAELAPEVKDAESVRPDPTGAAALIKQWREVIIEMTSVLAGVGVLGIGASWAASRLARAYIRIWP